MAGTTDAALLRVDETLETLLRRIGDAQVLDPRADVLLDEAREQAEAALERLSEEDRAGAWEAAVTGVGVLRAGEVMRALSFTTD